MELSVEEEIEFRLGYTQSLGQPIQYEYFATDKEAKAWTRDDDNRRKHVVSFDKRQRKVIVVVGEWCAAT